MNICVYCSASKDLNPVYYDAGHTFGKEMGRRGHTLVFGGSAMGVMLSVAEGVKEAGGRAIGVIPDIFNDKGLCFSGCDEKIVTRTMGERKKEMERISDAYAILPGGIGTMDEFFEVFVLVTLNQMDAGIAVLNTNGCYDYLKAFLDQYVKEGFLTAENRDKVPFFTDEAEMISYLEER